jgi:hypothetical protein
LAARLHLSGLRLRFTLSNNALFFVLHPRRSGSTSFGIRTPCRTPCQAPCSICNRWRRTPCVTSTILPDPGAHLDATEFANVLNQLEESFYTQALAKFQDSDFTAAGFPASQIAQQTLAGIQQNEQAHIDFLQQGLTDNGAQPLTCNFKFGNALNDVPTMLATARVVEYVGVSAFLGAANLLDDPTLLDAAASILTVEARHQTALNIMSSTGTSIPSAFDVGLEPGEVASIAGAFIDGPCDLGVNGACYSLDSSNLDINIAPATNPLTLTNTGPINPGTLLTFSASGVSGTDGLFCNMITGGATESINLPLASCNVPQNVTGPVALWITSDSNPIPNDVVARGKTTQLAGPAITFVDTTPDALVQLVRGSSTSGVSGSGSSNSTSTSDSGSTSSDSANGQAAAPAPTPVSTAGPSPDGKVTVNGLSMVPAPAPSATGS